MKITSAQKFKLKHFIKNIENYRGRHTELVSVYVPEGYDINKIIQHLLQEQGTATNIKSKATQKNVVDALERMIQHLRLYKRTPPHGLAAFSGNISEREGQSDVQVWSIEPPIPLRIRIYRCDKEFILEPLRDICEVDDIFGLVVMDKRDGSIGILKGKTIVPLVHTQSSVPGKHKTGGQSAQRFERLREGAAVEFYKRIGEYMKDQFLDNKDIKGILVGGPGRTKVDFVDGNHITNEVKRKIIAVKDLSYTGEFGFQELVDKCEDVLADEEISDEKNIMALFFNTLAKEPGKVSYGKDHVKTLLEQGIVETLLLSESLDDDEIEQFEAEAEKLGSTVKLISVETREGAQLKELGKIAALLRYDVDR